MQFLITLGQLTEIDIVFEIERYRVFEISTGGVSTAVICAGLSAARVKSG